MRWRVGDEEGFCCLGVAAVVWGIATAEDMMVGNPGVEHEGPKEVYDTLRAVLPKKIDESNRVL